MSNNKIFLAGILIAISATGFASTLRVTCPKIVKVGANGMVIMKSSLFDFQKEKFLPSTSSPRSPIKFHLTTKETVGSGSAYGLSVTPISSSTKTYKKKGVCCVYATNPVAPNGIQMVCLRRDVRPAKITYGVGFDEVGGAGAEGSSILSCDASKQTCAVTLQFGPK